MGKKLLIFTAFFMSAFQIKSQQVTCVDLSSKSTPLFFWQAIKALGIENKALNLEIKQIAETNTALNEYIKELVDQLDEDNQLNKRNSAITARKKGDVCCPTTVADEIIREPGVYKIEENENVYIEVDSSDVTIDLCCKTVSGIPTSALPIITVLSGYENITIKNGTLDGSDKINDGIVLEENTNFIRVENVDFLNCCNGIIFDGANGEIKNSQLTDCSFTCCNEAASIDNAKNCLIKNCAASHCKESGFVLTNSSYNLIASCETKKIGNDNPEKHATAFSSSDGTGNLFLQCTTEGTFKGASEFCKKATSFLLNDQEKETKIINCIANSTNCIGDGNAYGIHLAMTLKDEEDSKKRRAYEKNLYTVSWSPNAEHIAIGGETTDFGIGEKRLYILNAKDKYLGAVAATDIDPALPVETTVDNAAWSPNGQFLGTGISTTAPQSYLGAFIIYKFNADAADPNDRLQAMFSLTDPPGFDIYTVLGIEWSPDNKWIAILSLQRERKILILTILHFDGENATIKENIEVGTYQQALTSGISPFIGDLSFSVDGKKIAVVINPNPYGTGNKPTLQIYEFNPLATQPLTLTTSKDLLDLTFTAARSVDFSPTACLGKYFIAVGGQNQIKLFSLEEANLTLIAQTSITELHVSSVKWSPDGKYLLEAGMIAEGAFIPHVKIFEFKPLENSIYMRLEQKISIELTGEFPVSCDWSPSGKHIITVSSNDDQNPEENIYIYEVGNVPEKCVLANNNVCNTTGGLCGIGIAGASGENLIMENKGYENNINFSWGVFNHFVNGLNNDPKILDNISVPLYFSGQRIKS